MHKHLSNTYQQITKTSLSKPNSNEVKKKLSRALFSRVFLFNNKYKSTVLRFVKLV